jgi:hypothetical protein
MGLFVLALAAGSSKKGSKMKVQMLSKGCDRGKQRCDGGSGWWLCGSEVWMERTKRAGGF